jgi:hypothetical protein
MKYYLDTEFNEFGGDLISLALVSEDEDELYISTPCARPGDWVRQNVIPILKCTGAEPVEVEPDIIGLMIAGYLHRDRSPTIIADWPDDIRYFCQALITGPGQMVNIPRLTFELARVDAYPSQLAGAVQHNALWDARALRALFHKPKGAARRLPPGVHQW